MKKYIIAAVPVVLALALAGCGKKQSSSSSADNTPSADGNVSVVQDAEETQNIIPVTEEKSYLLLVNKDNPIPSNWENDVQIVVSKNSLGENISFEKSTYSAYLYLKEALEAEGINIDVSCAYKSFNELNNMILNLTQQYDEEYAKQAVDTPGFSEYNTGLALDLYLNIGGTDITDKEALAKETDTWAKIHEKLPEYGFILRYPEGKEDVTGYSYQPWHIRYVGSAETAKEITDKGIALEEYGGVIKANG